MEKSFAEKISWSFQDISQDQFQMMPSDFDDALMTCPKGEERQQQQQSHLLVSSSVATSSSTTNANNFQEELVDAVWAEPWLTARKAIVDKLQKSPVAEAMAEKLLEDWFPERDGALDDVVYVIDVPPAAPALLSFTNDLMDDLMEVDEQGEGDDTVGEAEDYDVDYDTGYEGDEDEDTICC